MNKKKRALALGLAAAQLAPLAAVVQPFMALTAHAAVTPTPITQQEITLGDITLAGTPTTLDALGTDPLTGALVVKFTLNLGEGRKIKTGSESGVEFTLGGVKADTVEYASGTYTATYTNGDDSLELANKNYSATGTVVTAIETVDEITAPVEYKTKKLTEVTNLAGETDLADAIKTAIHGALTANSKNNGLLETDLEVAIAAKANTDFNYTDNTSVVEATVTVAAGTNDDGDNKWYLAGTTKYDITVQWNAEKTKLTLTGPTDTNIKDDWTVVSGTTTIDKDSVSKEIDDIKNESVITITLNAADGYYFPETDASTIQLGALVADTNYTAVKTIESDGKTLKWVVTISSLNATAVGDGTGTTALTITAAPVKQGYTASITLEGTNLHLANPTNTSTDGGTLTMDDTDSTNKKLKGNVYTGDQLGFDLVPDLGYGIPHSSGTVTSTTTGADNNGDFTFGDVANASATGKSAVTLTGTTFSENITKTIKINGVKVEYTLKTAGLGLPAEGSPVTKAQVQVNTGSEATTATNISVEDTLSVDIQLEDGYKLVTTGSNGLRLVLNTATGADDTAEVVPLGTLTYADGHYTVTTKALESGDLSTAGYDIDDVQLDIAFDGTLSAQKINYTLPEPFELKDANGTVMGTITFEGGTNDDTVALAETLTITATPAPGYKFKKDAPGLDALFSGMTFTEDAATGVFTSNAVAVDYANFINTFAKTDADGDGVNDTLDYSAKFATASNFAEALTFTTPTVTSVIDNATTKATFTEPGDFEVKVVRDGQALQTNPATVTASDIIRITVNASESFTTQQRTFVLASQHPKFTLVSEESDPAGPVVFEAPVSALVDPDDYDALIDITTFNVLTAEAPSLVIKGLELAVADPATIPEAGLAKYQAIRNSFIAVNSDLDSLLAGVDAENPTVTFNVPDFPAGIGGGGTGENTNGANIALVLTFDETTAPITWNEKLNTGSQILEDDFNDGYIFAGQTSQNPNERKVVLWINTNFTEDQKSVSFKEGANGTATDKVFLTVNFKKVPVVDATTTPDSTEIFKTMKLDKIKERIAANVATAVPGADYTIASYNIPEEDGDAIVTLKANPGKFIAYVNEDGVKEVTADTCTIKAPVTYGAEGDHTLTITLDEKFDGVAEFQVIRTREDYEEQTYRTTPDESVLSTTDTIVVKLVALDGSKIDGIPTITINNGGDEITVNGTESESILVAGAVTVSVAGLYTSSSSVTPDTGSSSGGSSGGGSSNNRPNSSATGGSGTTNAEIVGSIADAKEGETVELPKYTPTISSEALSDAADKGVILEVELNDTYKWTIDPSEMENTDSAISVNITSAKVDYSEVKKIEGADYTIPPLSFTTKASGFGESATLTVTTKARFTDDEQPQYANLYKTNEDGSLEFVCAVPVDGETGEAVLPMNESGTYTLVVSTETKMMGDLNNDCVFDFTDLMSGIDSFLNSPTPITRDENFKLDFDGDGSFSFADLMKMINEFLGL